MEVKNYYPELPEHQFARTVIQMPYVVAFAKTLNGKYDNDTIKMAYAIFRNESANGTKGVNNNYAGIQADVGRWENLPGNPVATTVKIDSGGDMRRFLCFNENDGYKISFELLCIKIIQRNMVTVDDYFNKWVGHHPSNEARQNFESLLHSGEKIFV